MSYDTINFRLQQSEVTGCSFIEEVPCNLYNVSEHLYNGSVVVMGYLKGCNEFDNGYKVIISNNQIKIKDCSLTKWYLGDNFKELSRKDTEQAIEKMSNELHLPIDKAEVTRLDFALNIITAHPVNVYLEHLGVLSRFDRLVQPTGIYYTQNNEKLCLYDKVKEQKKAGVNIPELYRTRNVLRVEQRYMNRVAQRLKVERVTGALLYDVSFFNMLLYKLENVYNLITKINDATINFDAMKTLKDLYKLGVLSLIQKAGGQNEILAQIKEAQLTGTITKKQALDLKKAINKASKISDSIVVPNEAITELNEKIKKAVKFNECF